MTELFVNETGIQEYCVHYLKSFKKNSDGIINKT